MGIKLWMVFEAVSNEEDAVRESLNDHVENLKSEEGVEVIEEEFDTAAEVENPHPGIEKGFSQLVEMRIECKSLTRAIKSVINYGPTYVQVEGPEHFDLNLKDSQEALQEVANTMHQYAQMGVGGVLVSKTDEE